MRLPFTILLAAALVIVSVLFLLSASPSSAAPEEASTGDSEQLGGVRFRLLDEKAGPEEKAKFLERVKLAGSKAGWTEARIESPEKITLIPPANYDPSMFGDLLEAIERAKLKRFGLQLIDTLGRTIGPDGKLVEE